MFYYVALADLDRLPLLLFCVSRELGTAATILLLITKFLSSYSNLLGNIELETILALNFIIY